MAHDLVVFGDLVADIIIPIERLPLEHERHGWAEGIFVEPGGAGNVLVAARRVGLDTVALGHLGPDRYGTELRQLLEQEGVTMRYSTVCDDRATVLCIVLADRIGQHVYLGVKDNKGLWPMPPTWLDVIRDANALYTDGYTLRDILAPEDVFSALAAARNARVPIFFDPGPSAEYIPRQTLDLAIAAADVLLLAEPELHLLMPEGDALEAAQSLLALGVSLIVLKRGDRGCQLIDRNGAITVPGFPVQVVDTVGAGDSFAAAFIAGWLRGGSPAECAVLANAMGALVATQRGAGTRIPPRERLLAMLADHPTALALA
ncbi:MAG: carbohydrate kinase family protein [Thermomicrobiales bacterium]